MDIIKNVNTAKDLLLKPKETMKKLKDKKVTMIDIIFYLAIINILTFLGVLIDYIFKWNTGVAGGLSFAILLYVLSIAGVIVFGFILNFLAPNFKTTSNKMQAMKLVSYAATPWLLLGIFNIFPALALISLLGGLYGLYILYLGIPILMETPKEQQMPYFIVGLVVYIVVMAVIYWLIGWIWWQLAWSWSYTWSPGHPYWP